MYCPDCKITVESGSYCPLCGKKMSADRHNIGTLVDPSCYDDDRPVPRKGVRFNFSKPLCLLFALILIGFALLPWFTISFSAASLIGISGKELTIISFRTYLLDTYGTIVKLLSPIAVIDDSIRAAVESANTAMLLIQLYFAVAFLNIALFGIIGLLSKGRARYFFARVGAALYSIGSILLIAGICIGREVLKNMLERNTGNLAVPISVDIKPCVWLFIALAACLLFRFGGIRLLRYLNGISSMNRGDYRTAEREFEIINCVNKLPKNFSKSKFKRGARHNRYGDSGKDYGDGVL